MGRLSDARKRAQKKKGSGEGSEPPAEKPARPDAVESWVARDEPMTFDEEPAPAAARPKVSLPSSGLAADILAMADAGDLAAPAETAPAPAPAPVEPRAEMVPRAHNISFFATPMREERKAAEATEHLATFFLSGEEYGVDVRLVQEIIRVTEITQVPRAPGFIKGVINLRGRIIPVVDLKRKLSLGEVEERARQSRIVVVKVRERLVGLLVDGASQVLKVPVSIIEPAPEEVVEIDANFIRGVAKMDRRLIILMDLPKVLALELREAVEAGGA
jgi:purine-binding chemotaxis protein CheW